MSDIAKQQTGLQRRLWTVGLAVFAFAAAVVAVYVLNFREHTISKEPGNWGTFSDYVGGLVNPAVGPATVVLVIVSINIQRRELAATIEEMRQANDSTARMIFEQTLFSWLENYHSPVRAIANSNGAQGRMPMVRWYNAELAPEVSVMRGTPLPTIHIASRFDGN